MFGQQQNQPEPEDEFEMTEQMLVTNLPSKILDKFVSVYVSMKKVKDILKAKTEGSPQTTVPSDIGKNAIRFNWKMHEDLEEIQTKFEALEKNTHKVIENNLTLLAHRIDSVKSLYAESKKSLVDAKRHFDEASHLRTLPSPFIKSFVTNIEKEAENVSQLLSTYSSYMRANDNQFDQSTPDYSFLMEQHKAMLRCSARVEMLQQKLASTQDELASRLKIDPRMFRQYEKTTEETCAQLIEIKYKQFVAQEKKKMETMNEESDLFGNSTKEKKEEQKQTGFGFGNTTFNFGNWKR
ncbi:hypothetical protein GPJ56_009969 [Histomonas meleagridis]|uniref:uncharacterized protein n=1 Tax=Histomonas meleagridis TaxID=135588 RepID=UPI00355A8D09|nr:hypothetical protein GPJ56_009969 [Histomonas meleagridis]KAH0802724.1 hypothetical protein GO595_004231 [Histomonas meleagridis]